METILIISSILLWVVLLLNLLLTLGLARRIRSAFPSMGFLKVGQKAPDFTAMTLQGEAVSLMRYAQQPLAIVFVSPDCRPCREELPRLQTLWPKAGQNGVELVLVSDADEEKTRPLFEMPVNSLPVLVAPRQHNHFFLDYKVTGTPSYYLIDTQGRVYAAGLGLYELEEKIEALGKVEGGDGMKDGAY